MGQRVGHGMHIVVENRGKIEWGVQRPNGKTDRCAQRIKSALTEEVDFVIKIDGELQRPKARAIAAETSEAGGYPGLRIEYIVTLRRVDARSH